MTSRSLSMLLHGELATDLFKLAIYPTPPCLPSSPASCLHGFKDPSMLEPLPQQKTTNGRLGDWRCEPFTATGHGLRQGTRRDALAEVLGNNGRLVD